jgi:hypothetical protein
VSKFDHRKTEMLQVLAQGAVYVGCGMVAISAVVTAGRVTWLGAKVRFTETDDEASHRRSGSGASWRSGDSDSC